MNRPRVILDCVAQRYAGANERIIEFSHTRDGKLLGGLISFYPQSDGGLRVDVYRTDPEVIVQHDRLVAAAPDLIAALETLVSDWDSVDPDESVPDAINVDAHWAAARAALAKAKGGAA